MARALPGLLQRPGAVILTPCNQHQLLVIALHPWTQTCSTDPQMHAGGMGSPHGGQEPQRGGQMAWHKRYLACCDNSSR